MTKPKPEIIYFRESLKQSVAADTYTFGSIIISFWLNYRFIGNNHFLDVVLIIMALVFTSARQVAKKFVYTDKKKLIKDLQDNKV